MLALVLLAVTEVVLAVVLIWYFKCRHTRYSDMGNTRSTGVDNPNYNNVYRGAYHSRPRVPMDYEVDQKLTSQTLYRLSKSSLPIKM